MKRTTFVIFWAAFYLLLRLPVQAQDPVPPPVADVSLLSDAQLDQLLGPIALYPDPLLAQLLPATTQPSEIVMADRYIQDGGDPNQIEAQSWSAGVKAMAHYPAILKWLDDNLPWTTQVGQSFLYQQDAVMNSIQRLRAQAQTLGNLQTTQQQTVQVDDGNIEIVPTNPEVVYVPVYQPSVVYTEAPVFGVGPFMTFGAALSVGFWLNHDWDWRDHRVIVWKRDHFRPRDWWYRPAHDRFVPGHNDFREWRPRTRPGSPGANQADRGWDTRPQRSEPTRVIEIHPRPSEPARRVEPTRPQPQAARPVERPPEPVRPLDPRREQTPSRIEQVTPRPQRAPEARPSIPPVRTPPVTPSRPPSGALVGVGSAREARDYSNRGQQSRQIQNTHSSFPGGGGADPSQRPPSTPNRDRH